MRLIDADELKLKIVEEGQQSKRYKVGDFWELNRDEIWRAIDDLPTIECKTGKWIHTDTQAGYDINGDLVWADMMKCETCGFEIDVIQGHIAQYNFCPNCGARMSE